MNVDQNDNSVTVIDDTLLVIAARRDRTAFSQLYVQYFDRVHAYCYRRLGNPEDAADATSTIFARALGSLESCREQSFRSWLFAIAHNVVVDSFRTRRPACPLDVAQGLRDPAPLPEDVAIERELAHTVTEILGRLTEDQRQVLELRLAGLTSKEIGEVLGKHPNAIDQAQFRAVKRLRALAANESRLLEGLK